MPTLREARLARTLSQRDLARMAGVTAKTVIDVELGRQEPRLRTIRQIAAALGVEPTEVDEFRRAIEEKVAAQGQARRRPRDASRSETGAGDGRQDT